MASLLPHKAHREPVVPISDVGDVDPLAVEIMGVHVGAAGGDTHVHAAEVVHAQRLVGASLPGAPRKGSAFRTVRVCIAHAPTAAAEYRARESALHGTML